MEEHLKYTHILVPVDGSAQSRYAVRLTGILASVLHATVYFLYVSPFDESTDEGDVSWLPESIVRPAADEAYEIFSDAQSLLPDAVRSECVHRAGTPADEILRFIAEERIELVVIGGRKLSRVSGFLLGSVTQTVLEHAHCSVMVAGGASPHL
nr:universal stress protein [uncultured Selenomonas sp.]